MALLGPLADALAAAGYDLLLSRIIPEGGRWLSDLIDTGRTDGLILIGQSDQRDAIEAAAARYDRMVVWGARMPGFAQVTVGTDNEAGGRMAAEHLIRQGRRRLAFLGNPDVPEFAARYRGFAAAVAAFAVEDDVVPVHLTTAAAFQEVSAFLSDHPAPDGVVAASDVIAMSAMQALAERGLRVPDDVAVVGYDDVPLARLTAPPLTTVRQDVERGARLLVDLLLRRIAGETVEPVELAPELVVRGSA
jgi:DNA-binding LacI/PurR family transcriptional regulator